jgi:GMP synthase-like glutamine amidotransferase
MNIGLLECDHVSERFHHIAGDYREMFTRILNRHATHLTLKSFDVCHGEMPLSIDNCDAYLCTGSRFSVYDDLDWIQSLKSLVRRLHEAGKPYVGICFGHQLLVEALGGRVARTERGWGVGVHRIEVLQHESWMQPGQLNCRMQFMHQDQVEQMPEDSLLLGRSEHCPIAMFRLGDKMLGIQAHPEFTRAYGEALLLDRVDRLGARRVQEALASLTHETDEGIVTKWILEFLNRNEQDLETGRVPRP